MAKSLHSQFGLNPADGSLRVLGAHCGGADSGSGSQADGCGVSARRPSTGHRRNLSAIPEDGETGQPRFQQSHAPYSQVVGAWNAVRLPAHSGRGKQPAHNGWPGAAAEPSQQHPQRSAGPSRATSAGTQRFYSATSDPQRLYDENDTAASGDSRPTCAATDDCKWGAVPSPGRQVAPLGNTHRTHSTHNPHRAGASGIGRRQSDMAGDLVEVGDSPPAGGRKCHPGSLAGGGGNGASPPQRGGDGAGPSHRGGGATFSQHPSTAAPLGPAYGDTRGAGVAPGSNGLLPEHWRSPQGKKRWASELTVMPGDAPHKVAATGGAELAGGGSPSKGQQQQRQYQHQYQPPVGSPSRLPGRPQPAADFAAFQPMAAGLHALTLAAVARPYATSTTALSTPSKPAHDQRRQLGGWREAEPLIAAVRTETAAACRRVNAFAESLASPSGGRPTPSNGAGSSRALSQRHPGSSGSNAGSGMRRSRSLGSVAEFYSQAEAWGSGGSGSGGGASSQGSRAAAAARQGGDTSGAGLLPGPVPKYSNQVTFMPLGHQGGKWGVPATTRPASSATVAAVGILSLSKVAALFPEAASRAAATATAGGRGQGTTASPGRKGPAGRADGQHAGAEHGFSQVQYTAAADPGDQLPPYRPWAAVKQVINEVGRQAGTQQPGGGASLAQQAQRAADADSSLDTVSMPWDCCHTGKGGLKSTRQAFGQHTGTNSCPRQPRGAAAAAAAADKGASRAASLQPCPAPRGAATSQPPTRLPPPPTQPPPYQPRAWDPRESEDFSPLFNCAIRQMKEQLNQQEVAVQPVGAVVPAGGVAHKAVPAGGGSWAPEVGTGAGVGSPSRLKAALKRLLRSLLKGGKWAAE